MKMKEIRLIEGKHASLAPPLPAAPLDSCTTSLGNGESVEIAVKLVRETKIWLYIHYIYSHTTNLNES